MSVHRSPAADTAGWCLEHSYAGLPSLFHVAVEPGKVRAPRALLVNQALAATLGLDVGALTGVEGAEWLAGNKLPPGAAPLAQAYAGHQYGHFTKLGDGRAILLGEQITPGGARFDIQLKGAGRTPFSRGGDGRAALGPMLREYIVSEAMHALGIPTTRSLAVTSTGEQVEREHPLPGAVLARVAASHIRVGTFEWASAAGGPEALRALVDYSVSRHFPECAQAENPARAFFDAVIERQAALLARWMAVGFVHGVMNTDNMSICGETIDYGPCAFMDAYDPATVFSSIDRQGRYAYANQPRIAQWNLARLAEALLALLAPDEEQAIAVAQAALERFGNRFQAHWLDAMRKKLGLFSQEAEDLALIESLLAGMRAAKADFTNTFAGLSHGTAGQQAWCGQPEFVEWEQRWSARLARQSQLAAESAVLRRAHNPVFIPRNHLVEAALSAAQAGDLGAVERLLEVLAAPYDYARQLPEYRAPAPVGAACYKTYCGT